MNIEEKSSKCMFVNVGSRGESSRSLDIVLLDRLGS